MKIKKFTLIEVLVAMSVFLIGIAPLLGVLAAVTENHIEYDNASKSNQFLKYAVRRLQDSNTKIQKEGGDEEVEGYALHLEDDDVVLRGYKADDFDNVYYTMWVRDLSSGLQEVIFWVGNSNDISESDSIDSGDDERIDHRMVYIHEYSTSLD